MDLHVYVCYIYRLGMSAILPKEAFSSLSDLVESMSKDGLKYNGCTEFKVKDGSEVCTIAIEGASDVVYVAHKLKLKLECRSDRAPPKILPSRVAMDFIGSGISRNEF
jgi:hypothetical protein